MQIRRIFEFIALAKKALGWEPRVPLEDGLKATIEYFEAFLRSARNN